MTSRTWAHSKVQGLQSILRQPRGSAGWLGWDAWILVGMSFAWWVAVALGAPAGSVDTAKTHAESGLRLAQAGDLKSAEAELRQAVHLSPNDPDYLSDLGGVLGMQKRLVEAGQYFERALKIDPDNLVVRRDLAANQWQIGRLAEARANLERILKVKPGDPPSLLLLGMVNENLKNYARAAELLESVPELLRQRPESMAALARAYYRTDRKQKARQTLEDLLHQTFPAEGVLLGADISSQEGDDETALRLFESIRSNYADRPGLAYQEALARYRAGHFPEGESVLLNLIHTGHPSSAVYNLLAKCYYKQSKFRETVEAMDQAIDMEPTRETNYLDLARMLTDHQLLSVAREVAKQAVEKVPNSFRAYMMKGLIEAKQGDYAEALASYRRAVTLQPDSSEAVFSLARMQELAGLDHDAEATFEQGVKRFPKDALIHEQYGLMLLKRTESEPGLAESRAVALLKRATALDGSLSEPHYQLGNLWLRKGRIAEALEELQTAARLSPSEAKTHYALSRAYRHLGNSPEAAKELAVYERLKAQEVKSN